MGRFFKLIGRAISWLFKKSLLRPVLTIYFWLLKGKKLFKNFALSPNSKYVFWAKRYVYKATVVIIIFIAAANNLMARELAQEDFGSQTTLARFLGDSPEQEAYLVTEEGLALTGPSVTNYLQDQGALSNNIIATPFGSDDFEGFFAITQGDSALVAPSLKDPEVLVAKRDNIIEYTVKPGDNISTIAQDFGVSSNTILWENNLTWGSTIRPGDTLTILPTTGISHTVASGETVSGIANKYSAEVDDIVQFNKLANASDVSIGEKLVIPGGIKQTQITQVYKPTGPIFRNIVDPVEAPDSGSKLLWPLLSKRITQYYYWGHAGVDVGDKIGNPIYASENGRVIRSGWNRGYGYNVVIDHGNGIKTLYAHASELLVKVGQSVSRGQTIARIGSTGWSTGPHLHYEVQLNGRTVNPLNYIN